MIQKDNRFEVIKPSFHAKYKKLCKSIYNGSHKKFIQVKDSKPFINIPTLMEILITKLKPTVKVQYIRYKKYEEIDFINGIVEIISNCSYWNRYKGSTMNKCKVPGKYLNTTASLSGPAEASEAGAEEAEAGATLALGEMLAFVEVMLGATLDLAAGAGFILRLAKLGSGAGSDGSGAAAFDGSAFGGAITTRGAGSETLTEATRDRSGASDAVILRIGSEDRGAGAGGI